MNPGSDNSGFATSGKLLRLVPLIVACALFMENLDSTVIATALPGIAKSLHEDPLHLSLAISSYLLSLSIFIPVSGWMADRYGARRVFRNAIIVFVIGSVACSASMNIGELIFSRILQGLGGAMMVPVGRLVLVRQVPKSELVQAMSWLTIPALIAPIVGPPLGGLIVTYASWRWIFLINVPIGILGYYLVSRFIAELPGSQQRPFDLAGWMLLGGGVAGLVFGFENLGKHVLPPEVPPVAVLAGIIALALYVRHARTDDAPVLRLSLLSLPTFRASVTGGSLFRIGVGSFSLLMPMMLQLGFGLSALASGSITFASAAGALLMKTLAQRIVRRFGFRRLLLGNTFICGGALVICGTMRPETSSWLIVGFLLVTGFFRSLEFTCINALAFADVSEADMSQATSFSGTAQQLALSIGVGVGSQVLNASLALRHATQLSTPDFSAAFYTVGLLTLASWPAFARLRADAGSQVSGHRLAVADIPVRTTQ
ncbi:MAG: family efflux transporter permease subunit [Nevskia sp.]|nr:family efflux transporter permease subunit [Nevskia sp.]